MRPRLRASRLALALLAAGCSGGTVPAPTGGIAAPTTTDAGGPPFATATADHVYVDAGRPTPANGPAPGTPERTLPTRFVYPARAGGPGAPPATGRFPVVVFAHGHNGAAGDFGMLFARLAAAGYVVAAPDFPRSRRGAPGGATVDDLDAQSGDLRAVVDRLAGGDAPAGLAAHLDLGRLAAGGHSLGAITALRYALHTCCADGRVGAVFSYAGALAGMAGGEFTAGPGMPALFVHGDGDGLFVKASRAAFESRPPPAYLIVLAGAGHSPPFKAESPEEAAAEAESPHRQVVLDATVAFLDRHLRGDEAALARLRAAVTPGVATLEEH